MFDMRSVFIVQILGLLVCFVILLMTWQQNRNRYFGLSCWTTMLGLSCVGYFMLALRDIAPDFISIIIANVLIASAFALFNRGIVLFYRMKSSVIPSIVLIATITFFNYFSPIMTLIYVPVLLSSVSHSFCCMDILFGYCYSRSLRNKDLFQRH
jgi:hypothetical protein